MVISKILGKTSRKKNMMMWRKEREKRVKKPTMT